MRTVGIVLLAVLVPLQGWAQTVDLTLNCQYESVFDPTTTLRSPSSGSFSAIVRMRTDGTATIEATTGGCFDYVGSFTELQVSGDCKNTIGGTKWAAVLTIDRISGEFSHAVFSGKSSKLYDGHCTPGKKMF
jgi:hypothetical protein